MNNTTSDPIETGTVIRFNQSKGFGFIKVEDLDEDVFFHQDNFPEEIEPTLNQVVEFTVVEGKKGLSAKQIEVISEPTDPFKFYYLAALGIYSLATVGSITYHSLDLVTSHFIGVNIACFILMGFDKGAAKAGSLRVPEPVIYVLGALGGTPGILLSANIFRHKTQKARFNLILFSILFAQIFIAGYVSGSF